MKKYALMLVLLALSTPMTLSAQGVSAKGAEAEQAAPSLRDQLMPSAAAVSLMAPAVVEESQPATATLSPTMQSRGAGVGLMIAGAALFLGGLIIDEGDVGTALMVAGVGIGAYGLYVHFR